MSEQAKSIAMCGQAPLEADSSESTAMTPMAMLDRAVASGASVEVLERLMALQERWEKNQARKAFDAAIARAKARMPVVFKEHIKTGAGGTYQYEDLASIAKAIDPVLAEEGLSYRFRTESNGMVKVVCVISHCDGHSEENWLSSAPDTTGSKNSIQAIGSAVTYLQRYTLKAALGIAASKDDDGQAAGSAETISSEQALELEELVKETGSDVKKLLAYLGVKGETLIDIPVAKFEPAKRALETKKKNAS